jgi:hypothetical protein
VPSDSNISTWLEVAPNNLIAKQVYLSNGFAINNEWIQMVKNLI